MSERLTLLPCPFCGGEPASYWIQGPHHNSRNNPDHFRVACCVTLEARTRVEAADKWNRRAALSSLSEEWVMVPKEPTPEMLAAMNSAGCDYHALHGNRSNGLDAQREVYAAALHASPPVGKD